jgi:pimeloyl-ACP methyl ester carboxylesterase
MNNFGHKASIILVHGALADGSSWNSVITPLRNNGLQVICAPIPLTSLSDDIAALNRVIERTEGPLLLAGHAYGGAVIGGIKSDRVKGLVYIAALAPTEGETVAEVFYREKPHEKAPSIAPDAHGFIWMPESGFADAFAQNTSPEIAAILNATQRPIHVQCIQEKAGVPAWKTKPSWFLIAEQDRMINPKTQHFMAERMQAQKRPAAVDHTPSLTAPDSVVNILLEAATAIFEPGRP